MPSLKNLYLKEHRTVTHRTHKIRHCQKKLSVADGKCMKNTTKEIPRCSNSSSYVVSLKKIILLINPDLAWITEAFECQFQMLLIKTKEYIMSFVYKLFVEISQANKQTRVIDGWWENSSSNYLYFRLLFWKYFI